MGTFLLRQSLEVLLDHQFVLWQEFVDRGLHHLLAQPLRQISPGCFHGLTDGFGVGLRDRFVAELGAAVARRAIARLGTVRFAGFSGLAPLRCLRFIAWLALAPLTLALLVQLLDQS